MAIRFLSDQNSSGNDITSVGTLQFTGGTGSQATMSWNADEETLDLIQNGATLQLGQEVQYHVKNQSGALIPNGTAVMAVGTLGASGRILIAPMVADGTVRPKFFLGVTTEDIGNGEDGKVTHFGKVRDIDTSAYAEGAVLWCDPLVPGGLTATEPAAPNLKIATAFVVNSHASTGTLFVRANTGIDLHTNHKVEILSPDANGNPQVEGQGLFWNNTLKRWENKDYSSIMESRYVNVAGDTMTGDLNISKNNPRLSFIDEGAIMNMRYDGGIFYIDPVSSLNRYVHIANSGAGSIDLFVEGNVGIGTTSPVANLHVNSSTTESVLQLTTSTSGALISDGLRIAMIGNVAAFLLRESADMWFATSNTERLRITSAGNVGIGTTSPLQKLHVAGGHILIGNNGYDLRGLDTGGTQRTLVRINNSNEAEYGWSGAGAVKFMGGGSYTERMRIHTNGNVGIGTTSPTVKLQVDNNSHNYIQVNSSVANVQTAINVTNSASTSRASLSWEDGTRGAYADLYSSTYLSITTQSSEKMRITSAGNVGIGNTNPSVALDVTGEIAIRGAEAADDARMYFRASDNSNRFTIETDFDGTTDNDLLGFRSASTDNILVLKGNGDVGLGTIDFGASSFVNWKNLRLGRTGNLFFNTVTNTFGFNVGRNFYFGSDASYKYLTSDEAETIIFAGGNIDFNNATSGTEDNTLTWDTRMRITSAGNVGINTTSPTYKLHVSGNSYIDAIDASATLTLGRYSGQPTIKAGTDDGGWLIMDSSGSPVSINHYSSNIITLGLGGGNVGIGTTSPDQRLVVSGNIRIPQNNYLYFDNTAHYIRRGSSDVEIQGFNGIQLRTNDSARVYISQTGNVGIGTTAPATTLDVNGTISSGGSPIAWFSGNYNRIFRPNGTVGIYLGNATDAGNYYDNTTHYFRNSGGSSTYAVINNLGNVGIGTTSPVSKLQIGSVGSTGYSVGNGLAFGDGTRAGALNVDGNGTTLYSSTNLIFSPGTTESVRITTAGNVGIGTTAPAAKLHIEGGAARIIHSELISGLDIFTSGSAIPSSPQIRIGRGSTQWFGVLTDDSSARLVHRQDESAQPHYMSSEIWSDSPDRIYQWTVADSAGLSPSTLMVLNSTGLGIGTTNPLYPLDVQSGGAGTVLRAGTSFISIDPAGSASAPSLIFNGDGNTGIWRPAADTLAVSTAGAERMRITAAGNVGIGRTPIAAALEVEGQIRVTGTSGYTFNAGGDTDGGMFSTADGTINFRTNGSERIRITSTGNVGIGTTGPSRKLHVVGGDVYVPTTSDTAGIGAFGGNSFEIRNSITGEHFNLDIYNRTTSAWYTPFHIQNTGNVGIGTTSPGARLEVKLSGSGEATSVFPTGNWAAEVFNTQDTSTYGGLVVGSRYANNDNIIFQAGNLFNSWNPYFTVKGGGFVGIGTTSPAYKLDVNGGDIRINKSDARLLIGWQLGSGGIQIEGGSGTASTLYFKSDRFRFYTDSALEIVSLTQAGDVGIGTTSPSQKLHVSGNIRVTGAYYDSNNEAGTSGQVLTSTGTGTDWKSLAEITGVDGTGTANYIAKWSDADTITNSQIRDDGTTVGVGVAPSSAKLTVDGSITAAGQTSYGKSYNSLDTTGVAVAGLNSSSNGQSALFTFTCYGGDNHYQRVVYSCKNDSGIWIASKVVDEGTNGLDVTASANGATITFTYKSRSGTQGYSPRVLIEHLGSAFNTSYL